jgi:hypothetical protein
VYIHPQVPQPRGRAALYSGVDDTIDQAFAAHGIGTGHSSTGEQARAREVLGVPDNRVVAYPLDLGYPADRPLKPNRRAFAEVVHQGRW